MRKLMFVVVGLTAAVALLAGSSLAGASTKFAYTETITDTGNLSVSFQEGGMKRFDAVAYQLDATASATYTNSATRHFPRAGATWAPDARGRISATLTTTLDLGAPSDGTCGCGLQRIEYSDVTLTNLTTGRTYRLDSLSRDYP